MPSCASAITSIACLRPIHLSNSPDIVLLYNSPSISSIFIANTLIWHLADGEGLLWYSFISVLQSASRLIAATWKHRSLDFTSREDWRLINIGTDDILSLYLEPDWARSFASLLASLSKYYNQALMNPFIMCWTLLQYAPSMVDSYLYSSKTYFTMNIESPNILIS